MIWSRYNFIFEKKQTIFLYNSRTNAFVSILEEKLKNAIIKAQIGDFSFLDEKSMSFFKKSKFILTQDDENSFFYEKKNNYLTSVFSKEILNLTILTTLNCNFKCPYCYEKDALNLSTMSIDVENAIVKFAKSFSNVKKIKITWYGGEPLLNFNSIERITIELEKLAIPIYHNIVTNAYLLDKRMSFFNNRNLESIQVTIDGLEDTHNKKRILKNNDGTFNTIITNIESFLMLNYKCNIFIRCNVDESNQHEFSLLYSFLNEKFNYNKRLIVYSAFVRNDNGQCSNVFLNLDKEADFHIKMFEKENVNNLTFKPKLTLGGCGANNILFFVISPNGEMYKCWNDIGKHKYEIGNILDNPNCHNEVTDKYLVGPSIYTDSKCKVCSFFPICIGGCTYKRIQNEFHNGTYNFCTYAKSKLKKFLEISYHVEID